MAQSNKRFFNTYFFEDPYVEGLSSDQRLLYLTLILNPHSNLAGCYEISIKKLKDYTAMEEEKIRAGIQKLTEDRKILFTGTWLSLKNFIKNQELNPNMCKNAFDIMKAAPKQNIIFIVSDSSGNAEPWLDDFVEKVEKGINASIDSKNRNLITKAKSKNEPIPLLEDHVNFSMSDFINSILNPSRMLLEGNRSPNHSPTIPQPLGEPWGEKEGEGEGESEREREFEYEFENEKEVEERNDSPFERYEPPVSDGLGYGPSAPGSFVSDDIAEEHDFHSIMDTITKKAKSKNINKLNRG